MQLDKRKFRIFLILLLAFSIFFTDAFLFRSGFGVFFSLYCLLLLITYIFIYENRIADRSYLIFLVPSLLTALSFFLYRSYEQYLLRVAMSLLMLALSCIVISGKAGLIAEGNDLRLLGEIFIKPVINLGLLFGIFKPNPQKTEKSKRTIPLLMGVLASLPILFLLTALFSVADKRFGNLFFKIFEAFNVENTFRLIFDIVLGTILALCTGSFAIYNAVKSSEEPKEKSKADENYAKKVTFATGFLSTIIILVSIFAFLQLDYLFFVCPPDETSASKIAREGFFEMALATAVVFLSGYISIGIVGKNRRDLPAAIKICNIVLCALDSVIVFSAAKKMLAYIGIFGLSIKRIFTLFIIFSVLIMLSVLFARCLLRKINLVFATAAMVSILFSMYSLVDKDMIVSVYNSSKYISGEIEPDIYYFYELSDSSIPSLVNMSNNSDEGTPLADYKDNIDTVIEDKIANYNNFTLLDRSLSDVLIKRNISNYINAKNDSAID
ncbi:MAG: DUF4173 domain-containing protein [Ruminococcaceae bacterium]|nr:DUF4173 domain-containing protein [Oscillospiraceae bacterium]